ncbi:MAG TPA: glycosyltransferase family 4 protein [Gaiellaceae bacterium]|nr:glycosyltransferase family 4 protein [Gaiellaceae bacterium]
MTSVLTMRVLIVNKFAHVTGGADRHCLNLADVLRRRGHEVQFLSTAGEANVEESGAFVEASSTHASRNSIPLRGQPRVALRALWNREAAVATRSLLRSFRPDVVHAHKLYTQLSVAPLVTSAAAGVPIVQTLHDFELLSASAVDETGGKLDRAETKLRYRALNNATYPIRRLVHVPRVREFVSVSRFVGDVYAAHGIRATVLPNFASVDRPTGEAPSFSERDGLVYVGRLRPEKGVADVLALAELLPDVTITVAGSGVLEELVRERALELPNLRVTGFLGREDVTAVLRTARIALVPSRWQEPGALAPLEAMELATPVVAYAVGGIAEYVGDAGAGRVVKPDVRALVEACTELYHDERAWEQASGRAVEAIATVHSPARYAKGIEEVYARAIGAGRR